jgi:hypothetical protein
MRIADPAERENLAAFVGQAIRLDAAAVVRLRRRPGGRVNAWVSTGFDALAVRACEAELSVDDTTVAGEQLLGELGRGGGEIDLGYSMDSAWRGALPPADGFVHVDDVPARVLVELAQRGVDLSREHGSGHPPASLLDQEVIEVTGAGRVRVGIPMRVVFALTAMGFIPYAGDRSAASARLSDADRAAQTRRIDPAELVRVRAARAWLRLDARYGSVAKRRSAELPLFIR